MPEVDGANWAAAAFAEFKEFECPIPEDLEPPPRMSLTEGDESSDSTRGGGGWNARDGEGVEAWLAERLTYLATLESHCLLARDAHISFVRSLRSADGSLSEGVDALAQQWSGLCATSRGAAAAVLARAAAFTCEASAQVFGDGILSDDAEEVETTATEGVAAADRGGGGDAAAAPRRRRRWPTLDRHVPELAPLHLAGDRHALQHNFIAAIRRAVAAPAFFEIPEGGDGAEAAVAGDGEDGEDEREEAGYTPWEDALSKRHMADHRRFCRLDADFLRGELSAAAEYGSVSCLFVCLFVCLFAEAGWERKRGWSVRPPINLCATFC